MDEITLSQSRPNFYEHMDEQDKKLLLKLLDAMIDEQDFKDLVRESL